MKNLLAKLGKLGLLGGLLMPLFGHTQTLIVMRHGEARQNVLGLVNSDIDNSEKFPLTEKGREQVQASARKLGGQIKDLNQKPQAVFASPLRRTRETAQILISQLGIDPAKFTIEDLLRETGMGDLEEMPEAACAQFSPLNDPWDHTYAKQYGGETDQEVAERMTIFLRKVKSLPQNAVVFALTHGSPMRELIGLLEPNTRPVPKPVNAEFRVFDLSK